MIPERDNWLYEKTNSSSYIPSSLTSLATCLYSVGLDKKHLLAVAKHLKKSTSH